MVEPICMLVWNLDVRARSGGRYCLDMENTFWDYTIVLGLYWLLSQTLRAFTFIIHWHWLTL